MSNLLKNIFLFLSTVNFLFAQNILKNWGFEENFGKREISYWQSWGGNVYEISDESMEGDFSVKFWWAGGLYQQLPTEPGYEYEFSAYLLNSSSEPLDGTKFALIELQFISGFNEVVCIKKSEIFNKNREIGKWYELKVKGIAPPNSSFVRAAIEFVGGEGKGIVCFDNLSLKLTGKKNFSERYEYSENLEGVWLIKKGDNSDWSKYDFNDSDWDKIEVPGIWELKFPNYDGFCWYRFHFKIPEKLKDEELFLVLGFIDDADEAYFNGYKIGETGNMPPYFQTAWNIKRQYEIPAELIQYGKENVLALRVYDNMGDGGIATRPIRIFNAAGLKNYFKEEREKRMKNLGSPLSSEEIEKVKNITNKKHARLKIKKLENGGWTFVLPNNKPFIAIGIEYEPLAMYGEMKWNLIERDLDIIKETGFNTIAVWCMDFNASRGAGRRMSIDEMVKLADIAKRKGLYIQFYLNLDRFIQIFPTATLANGEKEGFDIDYCNVEYREFIKNFAKRLAISLYPYENVSTIVVWEEKIGVNIEDFEKEFISVKTLFCSKYGKEEFKKWLINKHKTIENLNSKWGTYYSSFDEAIDKTLLEYFNGVLDDDHRQFDILEFGQIMLINFTKDFVDSYKTIDKSMLFQCRNWDLFGPVRAVDPRYSFLDSFGINQYSFGHKGYDITLREEVIRMKLVSGIIGIAPYVSNFGFRSISFDNATHGLVPNEEVKASMGADTLSLFQFLPEFIGTSYFNYFFKGREGPFGIIKNINGEPLPIVYSFKAVHSLISKLNEEIALSDYIEKPKIYIFHGLDAIYDIRQKSWIEHSTLAWDLMEMNLNYEVISDNTKFSPAEQPIIIANFHIYDKKLDKDIVKRLIKYCKEGGILVIGNHFGKYDRYLWQNIELEEDIGELRGINISGELKRGKVKVIFTDKKYNISEVEINDTWYVQGKNLTPDVKVLLEIEVEGKKQPGLISKKFGKGKVYYFLFNPYCQQHWFGDLTYLNRTSLPIFYFLFNEMGLNPDKNFGNKGFNLKNGRINVYEKPIHYYIYKNAEKFGTYKDEYSEDNENYSGGVITDNFISFHGRQINERGWNILSSNETSIYAALYNGKLYYCTTNPVKLILKKDKWNIEKKTESYKVYVEK